MNFLPRSKTPALALILLGCTAFTLSTPALADKAGKDKQRGHAVWEEQHEDNDQGERERGHDRDNDQRKNVFDPESKTWRALGFNNDERESIRRYIGQDYKRHCPPGLAKKHNGCLPPGQAKKYKVGETLPDGINYNDLPRELRDLLGKPPRGYRYTQVDNDVLLISEAGKKIIDVVTLLSALGN